MSRHTDPTSLDTNTRGSPRPHTKLTYAFAQRHKSDKNRPVNLAKEKLLLLPWHFCINFNIFCLNQQATMSLIWLTKLEKSITWPVKAARTARAKWRGLGLTMQPQAPDTVEKLLQVYEAESCPQQTRFSSCKHLSLVSFVNSFQFFDS